MFIAGFFSQQEGVLGRYAPLLVTVHLRMPLMQTTVDTMSIFEASWVASKFECIAMLKKVSKKKTGKVERNVQRLQLLHRSNNLLLKFNREVAIFFLQLNSERRQFKLIHVKQMYSLPVHLPRE